MMTRLALLFYSFVSLSKSVTIAINYSNQRQQFKNHKNEEIKIINYQTQQKRLYEQLSKCYVILMSSK